MRNYLLALLCLLAVGAQAQTTLAQETFEGAGTDFGYTSNTASYRNATVAVTTPTFMSSEYFFRQALNASGAAYAGTTQPLTNQQGSYTWTAENVRGDAQANLRPAGYVALNPITNSQNYKSFVVTVAMAAPRGGAFAGAGANGVQPTDRVRIQYSFGGPWTTARLLMGNNRHNPARGDFEDIVPLSDTVNLASGNTVPANSGTVLDQAYRDIVATLPATAIGANLRVRVVADIKGSELAFDNIRVTGVLDNSAKPTLTGVEAAAASYTEGGSAVQLTNSLLVGYSDNSATTLTGGTVTTGGFVTGQDRLNFTNQNGITGSFNTGTGLLTLSGTATQATYQAALRSITYSNSNTTTATGGTRGFTFQVYNGATLSTTAARNLAVTVILNAPAALNYTENFDADAEGTRYSGNPFVSTPSQTGFFRATNSPATFGGSTIGTVAFTGWSGGYWFGEGNDNANNAGAPTSTMQLAPVNASGSINLRFTIAVGSGGAWLGYINATNPGDSFELFYRLNGGTPVKFGAFYGGATGTTPARQDGDLDRLTPATGTQLSPALQDFTFNLPAAAAVGSLDFLLVQAARGGSEIAFDNIRITGTAQPTVTTNTPATNITTTSATLGGSITSSGGGTLTERGVVYVVGTGSPTTSNTKALVLTSGVTASSFSGTVSGLTPGTQYTVRAYATNEAGTSYGAAVTFATTAVAPTVTTAAATTITGTSATLGGNVTATGGASVTERGVVYLVGTGTPTTSNTKDPNGNGTGPFSETISGLTPGTTYSVRAYATNSVGTSYGSVVSFTTPVTVVSVTGITPSPTATATVTYQVVFSGSVTGVSASNFSVTSTTSASVVSVSGTGTTYTVTVNTGTGNGTLRLNVVNATGITPAVTNTPFTTGTQYTITKSFTTPVLTVQGTRAGPGVDVTAFVDQVRLVTNGTTTTVSGAVANASFETHGSLSNSNYGYTPTATPWTFNGGSGIAENGSAFGIGTAPHGVAVAFLQSGGTNGLIQQRLAAPAGTYQVRFLTAQRSYGASNQLLHVFIKQGTGGPDVFVGSIQPVVGSYTPEFVSSAFTVNATAPTDIVLSANTVAENAAPNTAVGTFSGTSATPGETYTFALVSGMGATDNASFSVVGNTLRTAAALNFEAQTSYGIRVRATSTSNASLTFEKEFTVSVTDVNEAPTTPTDANAAANTVAENAATGTTVGLTATATDPDAGTTLTYSLTDDAGGRFAINASTGIVTVANGALLTFETAASHSLTVQVSDGTLTASQSFSVTVTNVNETPRTPTDTNAAANTVAENAATGTSVGLTAFATDPDPNTTLTYSLTSNAGGRFTINASTGVVTVADGTLLNFEAAASHSITVQATDGALASSQSFTIQVSNVNEAPSAVTDANGAANTVDENAANTTTVGITATAIDPDASTTLTYSLTDNAGGRFAINASSGVVTVANGALLDFETATSHSITVQASDGALTTSQSFAIQVTDVDDTAPAAPVVTTPADGSLTADASPAVTGTAEAGSTIRVYLNNVLHATTTATGAGTWSATISGPLTDGDYTVRATATDAAGNASPNSSPNTFTVDTTAPNTALTATPANPSNSTSASFSFTGNDGGGSGVAAFEASLDGGGFTAATSPQTYTGLSDGSHTFEVRATDAAGNVDPTPASYTWLIDTDQPTVSISSSAGASGGSTGTSPIPFTVTFSEDVTGFEAGDATVSNGTLSDFSGTGTTYTFNVTPAAAGAVTVNVPANAAQDEAGNGNPVAAPYSITYTPAPVDLVVSTGTADTPERIAAGTYRSIIITGKGYAQLSGAVAAAEFVLVQGGLLTNCQPLTGAGSFTLTPGATLGICDAAGLSSASGTGAVQTTGPRNFSTDALYVYTGTEAQVTGNALPATVRELVVNSAQGLTLTQPVRIRQRVQLLSDNLDLNGQALTLLSDANGTALVANTGGRITGSTGTMQRYIGTNTAANSYRHYSSPVQADKLSTLAAGSYTPDFSGADAYNKSATPGTVKLFPTVFAYNQDRIATSPSNYSTFDKGFEAPTSGEQLMEVGRGYAVQAPGNILVDFTGQFTSDVVTRSDLNRSLNAQGTDVGMGWHLLGNPYPSPIDWSTMTIGNNEGDNLQELNAAVYVVQSSGPYTGTYRTYLAQAPNDETSSPIIPAGQGFFVRTTTAGTAGTLRLTNDNRVTDFNVPQPSFGRGTADERPLVRLSLRNTIGTSTDKLTLYADAKATAGVDAAYDATKLSNPSGLNLSAVSATGETLAIDGRPAFTSSTAIALRLNVPTAGPYTLSATSVAHLPAGLVAYLRDAATGQQVNLSSQPTTTVTLAAGLSTRYSLVFAAANVLALFPTLTAAQVALYPNPALRSASVRVTLPVPLGTRAAHATVLNALGQVVGETNLVVQAGQASGTLRTAGLATGVYVVRLQAGSAVVSKRLMVE